MPGFAWLVNPRVVASLTACCVAPPLLQAVESLYEAGSLVQAVASTKPRILVCTPSNAACDELMRRIMEDRFCDNSGNHPLCGSEN